MLLSLVGRCGIPGCRVGECAIEMKLCGFELRRRCPKQSLRPQRGFDSRSIIPSNEASLCLSNEIPELGQHQSRRVPQMALELKLVKTVIVEAAEGRREPTEG